MTKTAYKLVDRATGIILAEQVSNEELNDLKETYQDIGYEVDLIETAAGGSTGASSIAVNLSGNTKQPMQLMKSFMNNFNSKVKNRIQHKHKKYRDFFIKIDEAFDMESVFSRLASMEKAGQSKRTEGTTFGIEDDNGNIMKVTVRADQAEEFEQEVARYLADIKMNVENLPFSKTSKNISMAELLFNMKDKFDIIDVEFPKIPGDVIYNADKATYKTGNMDIGATDTEGEFEDNPMDPLDLTDFEEPQSPEGETGDMDMEDELADAESVEDFPEETEGSTEGSILAKVIDMLKAQAESEVERAKAEAEKARAEQARYTAQATQFAMRDQEERLRYELEMEEQKKREREAKKMAELAKHRISKTLSLTSGISEADEGATPAMVLRQRQAINARYAVQPTDTPEDRQYKAKQRAEAMREWTSRYRQALNKERYDRVKAEQEKRQGKQPADPRQQKQQQQQPNAQQGDTNEI